MTAPPTGPAPAAHSNPPRQQAQVQGGSQIGRFLGVVSWLITYGKDLADKLRQHAGTPAFAPLARPFGTTNLAAILARITRGLRLAVALHERLTERAARGRDITPPPPRLPAPHKSGKPCPRAQRARPEAASDVVALPTPQEIAALLRRRPLGTVIAEICRDLGIMPGDLEPELWRELFHAITEYGGSFSAYFAHLSRRLFPSSRAATQPPAPRSCPPVQPALATGPLELATGPP